MNTIAVAIPAYNEQSVITDLLHSARKLHRHTPLHTIVICDNKSSDLTIKRIEEFRKLYPKIPITIAHEPIRGIATSRKRALDTALHTGADFLLNIDADCTVPATLLGRSLHLLQPQTNAIVTYTLEYSKIFQLVSYLYYKPLKHVMSRITRLQEKLLGPSFYTGCVLFPASVYQKIYWEDAARPIIPDDDFLLSRRLNAMGTKILRSGEHVLTADRRFWANPKDWMEHVHTHDYRNIIGATSMPPPTKKALTLAVHKRLIKGSDRILQSIVEYMFLASFSGGLYDRAESLALSAMRSLGMPASLFQKISEKNKIRIYHAMHQKYFPAVYRYLSNYVGSPL